MISLEYSAPVRFLLKAAAPVPVLLPGSVRAVLKLPESKTF